jgi:predicted small secreted protein
MTRKLAIALFGIAVASPLVLTGCNTVQGFGQDISATGRAVEDVATYNEPAPTYYNQPAPRYYNEPAPRYYNEPAPRYSNEGRYYIDRWGNRHYY